MDIDCSFCGSKMSQSGISRRVFRCLNPNCPVGTANFLDHEIQVVFKTGRKVTFSQIGQKVVASANGKKIGEADLNDEQIRVV